MSDQEMIRGLLARDETALRRIYELYGNYLRRIAGNILESPEATLRTLEACAAQPAKEAPPETPEAARKRRLGLYLFWQVCCFRCWPSFFS